MPKPAKTSKLTPARTTFRHGDLHRALLAAGVELARTGGPAAIILREATRRAGVAPNAAYRHFSSHAELLAAVRAHALSQLARAIEAEIAAIPPRRRGAALARAHLRAVGFGYLTFALHQPGLFRTAFSNTQPVAGDTDHFHALREPGLHDRRMARNLLHLGVDGHRSEEHTSELQSHP